MNASRLRRLMNWWPPFLFSGIRVTSVSDDFRGVDVELRQHWYNRNYVGSHFGGSLFAMTDPFWMIMVLRNLGTDYLVWDQAAEIVFVKPGRGTVRCGFRLESDVLDEIRLATANGDKYRHWFAMDVIDGDGGIVARVRKQVYVRRKPGKNPETASHS